MTSCGTLLLAIAVVAITLTTVTLGQTTPATYKYEGKGTPGSVDLPDSGTKGNSSKPTRSRGSDKFSKGDVRYAYLFGTPVIVAFGLVGNLLSFLTLRKLMSASSETDNVSHFYLAMLAIFDSCALMFSEMPNWMHTVLKSHLNTNDIDHYIDDWFNQWGFCQARFYFSYVFRSMSVWLVMLFTVERYRIIRDPFRAQRFSVKRAKLSCLIIVLIALLTNIQHVFGMVKKPPSVDGKIFCRPGDIYFISLCVQFPFISLIPAVVLIVCNVLIVRKLYQHKKSLGSSKTQESSRTTDQQVTRRLLVISVTFVVLTTPCLVFQFVRTVQRLQKTTSSQKNAAYSEAMSNAYSFVKVLFTINFAVNFILYCLTGARFRRALKALFLCQPIKPVGAERESSSKSDMSLNAVRVSGSRRNTSESLLNSNCMGDASEIDTPEKLQKFLDKSKENEEHGDSDTHL